jgi:hypothetical protein
MGKRSFKFQSPAQGRSFVTEQLSYHARSESRFRFNPLRRGGPS